MNKFGNVQLVKFSYAAVSFVAMFRSGITGLFTGPTGFRGLLVAGLTVNLHNFLHVCTYSLTPSYENHYKIQTHRSSLKVSKYKPQRHLGTSN